MDLLLPHIVNGLTLGLLFAMIALGFTLIVGVMEIINLAHGSLFALGAYFAMAWIGGDWFGASEFGIWWASLPVGMRYASALIFGPLCAAAAGMVLELCVRRTYGKAPLYGLLLTFGAALVIEELIRISWGDRRAEPDGAATHQRRFSRRRHDFLEIQVFFRRRLRRAVDRVRVALSGEDPLRRHHQGRQP
ncbi:branched-chain amino acid ABC transporter permease [Roseibium salinum]|nr:branched-chain amino acid ABC transporter permease [Roseibium salinum]